MPVSLPLPAVTLHSVIATTSRRCRLCCVGLLRLNIEHSAAVARSSAPIECRKTAARRSDGRRRQPCRLRSSMGAVGRAGREGVRCRQVAAVEEFQRSEARRRGGTPRWQRINPVGCHPPRQRRGLFEGQGRGHGGRRSGSTGCGGAEHPDRGQLQSRGGRPVARAGA